MRLAYSAATRSYPAAVDAADHVEGALSWGTTFRPRSSRSLDNAPFAVDGPYRCGAHIEHREQATALCKRDGLLSGYRKHAASARHWPGSVTRSGVLGSVPGARLRTTRAPRGPTCRNASRGHDCRAGPPRRPPAGRLLVALDVL